MFLIKQLTTIISIFAFGPDAKKGPKNDFFEFYRNKIFFILGFNANIKFRVFRHFKEKVQENERKI